MRVLQGGQIDMKRGLVVLAALTVLAALVSVAGSQAAARPDAHSAFTDGRYIVTFADDPVASYDGYVNGFPPTKPQAGNKLNPDSPAAQKWQARLVAGHDAALAHVGATKVYDYTIASNGIAADLTAAQAAALAKTPDVVGLTK